jgi:hypothetical protein
LGGRLSGLIEDRMRRVGKDIRSGVTECDLDKRIGNNDVESFTYFAALTLALKSSVVVPSNHKGP